MSILKFVHFIILQCKTTTWNDLNFASSELNPSHQYHDSNEIWRLKGSDCFKSLVFSLFPMPTCTRTSPPPPFANSQWKHHFWWRIRFSLRLFSVEKSRFLSLTFNLTQMIRPQLIAKRNSESKGLFFADLPMFYKFLRWLNADRGDFVMVSRAVCASEANELPLSMQWHDSTISKTSVCFEFDYQWSLKFYFWKPIVTDWNGNVPNPLALQIYAEAISRKGSPLQNCFGFTNGSVRPTQDLTLGKESFTMDTRECMG